MSVKTIDNSKKIKADLNGKIHQTLLALGIKLEAHAKEDGVVPVDTGRLKNSISYEVDMSRQVVYVGSAVSYAKYQEVRKHFLKRAFFDNKDDYKEIIRKMMKN